MIADGPGGGGVGRDDPAGEQLVRRMPMFPLGTVLLPSGLLPLRLFEDRYLRMVEDLLAADREFGVVLIRRGREVGGGDDRYEVGTRARIVEAERQSDGRWAVVAVGVQRLRVTRWLPDDPYPVAEVEPLPDDPGAVPMAGAVDDLRDRVRRLLAGLRELGERVPAGDGDLADDPGLATFQLVGLAPIAVHDRQRLLELRGAVGRAEELDRLVGEAQEVVDLRLAGA